MAETRSLPVIEEEEIIDDDFYEKIEAPKFVDLTAPDPRKPDEDRHWFCLRFGCDQKHEEELDSEAVYKNFVLRVMAARSPNVRLRKALNKREASENLRCPLSAPAKPRVSRMALISSLSHKMADKNVRVKQPLVKVSATPNAKVKQSPSGAKALTTPRNQKKVSNMEPFRTIQSKKTVSVAVPKSRMVAKALVFHSPKKAVKIKSSIELKTPMKSLCSAMKKLELNSAKKNGAGCINSMPASASRKQLRGREVKSRVFDSLYSNNRKGPETNNVRCLKKIVKGMQKCQVTVPHEETENDSSDMEIDEKSRGGSLERCAESGTSGGGNELSLGSENSNEPTRSALVLTEEASVTSQLNSKEEENKTIKGNKNEEKRKPVLQKRKAPEATKRKDEENSMTDNKENQSLGEHTENDDKENASAPDANRLMTTNNEPKKAILGSKVEDSRKTDKKSTSTSTGSQVVKYRKLKPTNPKPFKLRTDERGILKEANLDKTIPPFEETTAKGSKREHQSVSLCIQFDNTNGKVQHKLSATTANRNGPKIQKPIDPESELGHGDKSGKKLDDNFKRTSQMMQRKSLRPRGILPRKKEKVLLATPCKLSVILERPSEIVKPKEEAAKPRQNDTSSRSKSASSTSRPCSRGRRTLTVPKEPKFHSLHVPKSCTRKLT